MPNIRRPFSGPNGPRNYIPDNGTYTFTRNVAQNIIRIDIVGPHGEMFHKIITRDGTERITDMGFWIQDAI